jgi:glycosyltransferase involved in cell wall biosynthesis
MVLDMLRLGSWCDIVHLHGYSTKNVIVTIIAKMFRKPIVMSLHTKGFDEPAVIAGHGSLAHWAFLSADLYLSVSSGLLEAYVDDGMPVDRILQIPNGIDVERFAPAADRDGIRRVLGLPLARPIIVFVGFFSTDKQPRVLFDAWMALQSSGRLDATLLFVGATRSPYFEVDHSIGAAMERDAAAAGLSDRLVFTGPTHDVHQYLRAADVFVLPSRREGLPVALLEAMACGLPCVASRLRGSTDTIIEDGVNGMLIPPGDVAALTAAIDAIVRDPAASGRLGAAARATITNRFSSTDIADRWLRAYDLLPLNR